MKKKFGDRIYGNENTNLVLTEKAERAYSATDPLKIIERADGTYSLRGCEDRDGMAEEEVNEWLEDLFDAADQEESF